VTGGKEVVQLEPALTIAEDPPTREAPRIPRKLLVQNDEIVRTAYGKKVGLYEQRLPRWRFEKIWKSIASMPKGREFSPQDVATSSGVPGYQAYIALDVLRMWDFLEAGRRGAYRIAIPSRTSLPFQEIWNGVLETIRKGGDETNV
jgi:hypothetical protein